MTLNAERWEGDECVSVGEGAYCMPQARPLVSRCRSCERKHEHEPRAGGFTSCTSSKTRWCWVESYLSDGGRGHVIPVEGAVTFMFGYGCLALLGRLHKEAQVRRIRTPPTRRTDTAKSEDKMSVGRRP